MHTENKEHPEGMRLNDFVDEQMKDPAFAEEWKRLAPTYDIVRAIIETRTECNLTQKELAERCGLKQNTISRLESGGTSPTLKTLQRLAAGMGKRLEIRFV